jgi:hypothetical protein
MRKRNKLKRKERLTEALRKICQHREGGTDKDRAYGVSGNSDSRYPAVCGITITGRTEEKA